MGIADDVQERFLKFSRQAKNTFDTAKLELKIKSYEKDCRKLYMKIGKLVYDSHKYSNVVRDEEIDGICCEIDRIKHNIKDLENQIDDIKNRDEKYNTDTKKCSNGFENVSFTKEKNDFKGSHDENGIKFLRFCSECGTGNEPDAEFCAKCEHKFENDNKMAK